MTEDKDVFQQPDEAPKHRGFLAFLRTNFLTGVIILMPVTLTFILLKTLIVWLDNFLLGFIPSRYHFNNLMLEYFGLEVSRDIHGMGLIVGFIVIVLTGLLTRNLLGRRLLGWMDSLVSRIPGVRSVYTAIKQITETLTSTSSKSFREVVMIEYPRKGLWSLAFVTGETKGEVQKLTDDEMVNVFLPTTPNPTSGYLLFVPRKDIRPLHMSVDQGLKMIISAGIVTPSITEGKKALRNRGRELPSESTSQNIEK